jgi:hypothetical protein
MVSSFRYFSFKESELLRRQPFWSLVAVVVTLALFIALPQVMLFVTFTLYAVSGPGRSAYVLVKRMRAGRRVRIGTEPDAAIDTAAPPPRPRIVVGGKSGTAEK